MKIVREKTRERKRKKGFFFRVYEHANHIENNGGLMGNYVDLEAVVQKATAQESLYRNAENPAVAFLASNKFHAV